MTDHNSQWHWGEGIKYALEGIKLLFILNGGSAIAILTFVGNAKIYSDWFVGSLIAFAMGSITGVVSMNFAYLAQLNYGNAGVQNANPNKKNSDWSWAINCHNLVYFFVGLGILFFTAGVGFAAYGIHIKPLCYVA